MLKPHSIVLRIKVADVSLLGLSYITDSLGECARELEAHQAEGQLPRLGLIPDLDDAGRFSWEIVAESYT